MAGRGVCLALACALVALGGCYSPSVDPCIYACGHDQSCPNGLSCNGEGMCAASSTAVCGAGPTDARNDAPADVTLDMFVDVTPPDTIIDMGPPLLDNNSTATFQYHSTETGGTFECAHDGGAYMACLLSDQMTGLTNGLHQFEVRARDAAGNVDPTPAKYSWTFDDGMPQTVLDSHPPLDTNMTTGMFMFHCVKPTDVPECQLDGGAFAACQSATSHTVSSLLDAAHTFTIRCKAPGGQTDPSPEVFTWNVDTQPPTTTFSTGPTNPTNDITPSFDFLSQAGSTFQCAVDNGSFGACSPPYTTNVIGDGPHVLKVKATDKAGNVEVTPATYSWNLDTVAPMTAFTGTPNSVSRFNFAMFTWTSEASASFECSLDGAAFAACSTSITLSNLGEGSHTFKVRASDVAGNVENPAKSFTWDVDLTNPTISFNFPTPNNGSTTGPHVDISWTTSETVATTVCSIDGVNIPGCTTDNGYNVPHGMNHVFQITVTDLSGRTGSKMFTWNVDCHLTCGLGAGTFGCFHFDETVGDGLMNFYSGGNMGYLGTQPAMGPPTDMFEPARSAPGRFGGSALSFDAAARQLALFPTGFATPQTDLTFELWVMPKGGATTTATYALMSTKGLHAQLLLPPPVGATQQVAWRITNNAAQTFEIRGTVGSDIWNQVIASFQSSTNTLRLYINGGQVTPTVTATGTVTFDLAQIIWGSNGTFDFTGKIDEPYMSVSAFQTADATLHSCPLVFQ